MNTKYCTCLFYLIFSSCSTSEDSECCLISAKPSGLFHICILHRSSRGSTGTQNLYVGSMNSKDLCKEMTAGKNEVWLAIRELNKMYVYTTIYKYLIAHFQEIHSVDGEITRHFRFDGFSDVRLGNGQSSEEFIIFKDFHVSRN